MIQYLTARQIVNSGLLGLDIIFLFFVLIWFYKKFPLAIENLVIAMTVHVIGLAIVRGWTAILVSFMGHKDVLMTMEDQYPFDLIGATIALVGMMWLIKIFSSPEWGNQGWIVSLGIIILFVSGLLLI